MLLYFENDKYFNKNSAYDVDCTMYMVQCPVALYPAHRLRLKLRRLTTIRFSLIIFSLDFSAFSFEHRDEDDISSTPGPSVGELDMSSQSKERSKSYNGFYNYKCKKCCLINL